MSIFKQVLLLSCLIAAFLIPIATSSQDICIYLPCPQFILQKEVNGVTLGFAPCCMRCEYCGDENEPVCLSSGDTFTTYPSACHACTTSSGGLIANGACPGVDGGEQENEWNEEGELANESEFNNGESEFAEGNAGLEMAINDLFISNE